MKVVATHWKGNYSWIPEYTDDYLIYNRGDCDLPNCIPTANFGDADYDRLSYIVDNYQNLPEIFMLTKSNLLDKNAEGKYKFISPEEFDEVKNNTDFTPLLTKYHKTYEPICRYDGDIYEEINNSWYLQSVPAKYFNSYNDFAREMVIPSPQYLQFAPGGNYIVTRERIHRWSREFYDKMRSYLPYCQSPGEAHMVERTYYSLWS